MAHTLSLLERNRELGTQLLATAKNNPQAPYFGKKVGIANGMVVVVADDWEEVAKRLQEADPNPANNYAILVGEDLDLVHPV